MAVSPEGGARKFQAAPMLASKPAAWPEALDLAAVAWTDGDIARFLDRGARLLRWGWTQPKAERLADRLVHCVIDLAPAECAVTGRRTST